MRPLPCECHPERAHYAKGFCKPCYNTRRKPPPKHKAARYNAEWRRRNPSAVRNIHLRAKFGIDIADYERMLAEQDGLCAICRQPESRKGRGGRSLPLAVDHCHKTNRVRGLLCGSCNTAIHKIEIDDEWINKVAVYLR